MIAEELSRPASTADVRDVVQEAAAHTMPLRIVAGGTWLSAGRPVAAEHRLALAALTGIVEYTAGDLTLTARAATSLAEIARVTAAERQWLALDPFGTPAGSIGATIATASAGPHAHTFGTPRDNVLGLETVTGTGAVVRAGGRVVKNVAGFDLTRLFTGSWGTLGVITEVTVRLRALPEADESYALSMDDGDVGALARRLRTVAMAPLALELVNPALAAHAGLERRTLLLMRLGASGESVRAQRAAAAELGDLVSIPDDVWNRLRECEPARAGVLRLSTRPSHIGDCWTFARAATRDVPGAFLHSSLARGIVRCIVPDEDPGAVSGFVAAARAFDGTRIAERLPERCWTPEAAPSAVADRLSRGVKHGYDPANVLNPGILGDGT
ncbi:MAG TPA: FAD-binding protein [Gemmatimonadaceae bacterium]|nr:FAD-binding protein [Gemmatimonadaceae bacterium]